MAVSSNYPEFDRKKLRVAPLCQRKNELKASDTMPLLFVENNYPKLKKVAENIIAARDNGAEVTLMMGAHVLRSGVQRYLINMIENGYITCIATNGACTIHDYELALVGGTTEKVAYYIKSGKFGLWKETGHINDIVREAARSGLGLGESIGKAIFEGPFTYKDLSVFAAGYRMGIPMTVHVGIGYDIVHTMPNCDGASYGATSYTDFLRFAKILEGLEGGVVMNFGSSVMAPEIFLKALSMIRNVKVRQGHPISNFTSLVCDLRSLPDNYRKEPSRDNPEYYFRPWKTMLVRTVAEGGRSFYLQAPHNKSIPALWSLLNSD